MIGYLRKIWGIRHFWLALARSDLRNRYRGSVLGIGWSLLHPIAITGILCAMFSTVFAVDPWDFAPHILLGLAVWNFLTACCLGGCQAIRFAEGYIRQAPLPMAIYPLRVTLSAGFHFLMACLLGISLVFFLRGIDLPLLAICLAPTLVLLFALGWSAGTVFAFHSVRFSDAPHLLEIFFQFLFLVTPVMYPASILGDRGRAWLLTANPVYHLLELFRRPIIEQSPPDLLNVLVVCGGTMVFAAVAVVTVWRLERQLIFRL